MSSRQCNAALFGVVAVDIFITVRGLPVLYLYKTSSFSCSNVLMTDGHFIKITLPLLLFFPSLLVLLLKQLRLQPRLEYPNDGYHVRACALIPICGLCPCRC